MKVRFIVDSTEDPFPTGLTLYLDTVRAHPVTWYSQFNSIDHFEFKCLEDHYNDPLVFKLFGLGQLSETFWDSECRLSLTKLGWNQVRDHCRSFVGRKKKPQQRGAVRTTW